MKKIVLLTSGYPFREKGEEFIIPEMRFLAGEEYDVQICAVTPGLHGRINQYKPENIDAVVLFPAAFSMPDKLKCCMRTFCRQQFWKEFFELLLAGNVKKIRTLISFCSRGERIFLALERQLGKNRDAVLYSYWLVDSAYAIAMLKQKYGYKAVSRVHGGDLYEERSYGYLPMRKYLFETLDAVYSVSEKGRNYLIEKYGHADKIHTSYLGTENQDAPREYEKQNYFHIASCSYLVPLKRVPLIAEALCLMKDIKIIWTHFGNGPDKEVVFEVASRFPENIVFDFKGNTPHHEIMEYYRENNVDLFINVSTTEGLPISLMEAISFGIPVIATDVGGNREIVNNDGFLLHDSINALELSKKIGVYYSASEAEHAVYRKNAYEIWNQKFNAAKNYSSFYSGLE